jgi:hypothetical protein
MFWRKNLLAAAAALLSAGAAWAEDDPEVDRWFKRHTDAEWRPLAERWASVKAAMQMPTENLSLPLDFYPDGRVKARLRAKKAQVFLDGMIFAEGVEVDMLAADGRPDGKLIAEGCLFDRSAKHGYCDGRVSVEKDGDQLKGLGLYFSIDGQFIKIMAECEIRTNRMRNNFGRIL